ARAIDTESAAARTHHADTTRHAPHALEVAAHAWRDVRVHDGRRTALVLAVLTEQSARQRYRYGCVERLGDGALVRIVRVAVQQADRNRFRVPQLLAKGGEGGRGERLELVAALVEATIDPDAVLTRHEWRGTRAVKCVELRSVLSPDLDHVLEAAVRDQHDAGAAALEQRVRRDRRSVNQQCCVAPGTQRLEGSVH